MEDRVTGGYFCLLNSVQTRFYVHPANYPEITGGPWPKRKGNER